MENIHKAHDLVIERKALLNELNMHRAKLTIEANNGTLTDDEQTKYKRVLEIEDLLWGF